MIIGKKRGPLGFMIDEAISSLDIFAQKPINIPINSKAKFDERLMNARKADISFLNVRDNEDVRKKQNTTSKSDGNRCLAHSLSNNSINDKFIKWFSEINNKDVKIVGGKGASLGEMFNNSFPVPAGFVITAQAYEYFVNQIQERIKKIIEKTNVENTEELNKSSGEIRTLIEKQGLPKELRDEIIEAYRILSTEKISNYGINENALNILRTSKEPIFVSVRSSATTEDLADASFAGQQESFLNIKGESNLIEYIKKCFSSLYTPRAIYYRNKKGFFKSSIAVVIQKMINSEKSGVVFSKDPIKQTEDIVIEAVFGLGEGIVSGKINPDYCLVSRELKIKELKVANKKIAIVRTGSGENEIVKLSEEKSMKQVLTTSEILEIVDYALKLEEHYKKPQDIEFAVESGEVFIIQSRPITTLGKKYESLESKGNELKGNVILQGLAASPGIGVGIVKIIRNVEDLVKIKKGDILVTKMTNPDMVVSMQKSMAIVTDDGGITSHAAIVSREMGIPAVVGTNEATKILKEGMKITVDGFNGIVYEGEVSESKSVEIKKVVETKRIKLKVILDLPDFAYRAAETGINSVGLLRLEGIIASSGKHPLLFEKEDNLLEYSKLLENGIHKIAQYFNSIWIRTSDIRTDEFSSLQGAPEKEINPMLGFHGVRFSLKHPKILMVELEAIKNVALNFPEKKFGVMFPQIINIDEVKKAKEYFEKFKTSNMEIGVMIETPASVQIIESISDLVNFVSFGTNDLTQYTLAVDRGEENVQYLYDDFHPAIFSQIKKVIDVCRRKRVETSICGQAGSKKEMVEFLFRKGINSISVNADAAHEISLFIKSLEDEWEKTRGVKNREVTDNNKNITSQTNDSGFNHQPNRNFNINKKEFSLEKLRKANDNSQDNQVSDSSSSSNNLKDNYNNKNIINQVNNKNNFKIKKWEKFRRWKERKKIFRENDGWNKKAEIGFDLRKNIGNDRIDKDKEKNNLISKKLIQAQDERGKPNHDGLKDEKSESRLTSSNLEHINKKSESNLLAQEKIELLAEREGVDEGEYEANIGPIEPLDSLERLEQKSEEISEEVKEDIQEDLEEREEIEVNIKTSGKRIEEDS
ncbi:MAG: phosphoenolpyruvate synthase [Nanoarchaeota archaeon]